MPSISRHIFSCLKFNFRYYYYEDFARHRLRCLDLDEFQCQDCDFFSSSVKVLTDIFNPFLMLCITLQEIVEHKMSTHL